MDYGLGVDLGTTHTAAAEWVDGRVEVVRLGARRSEIPSLVYLGADGTILVGEAAERRGAAEPGRLAREFKRRVGDPVPVLVGGAPHSAHALMARLLQQVLQLVTGREQGPPARVTVTHPANWGPYKRELIAQAVRLAGVDEVTLAVEPEAAAVRYAAGERVRPGEVVAVYDLGGGTFDAAVLRKTEAGFTVLGEPEGIEQLGGIDFDEAVFAHVTTALGEKATGLDPDDQEVTAAMARLRRDCLEAKEALSFDTEVMIPVALPGMHTRVRLNRSEFESMIRPALTDTLAALRRALRSAGVETTDLKSVLLAGGSSRIPLVQQMVAEELGRPVVLDPDPEHSIAMGAALLAAVPLAAPAGNRPGGRSVETAAASGPTTTGRAAVPGAAPPDAGPPPAGPTGSTPPPDAPSEAAPPRAGSPGAAPLPPAGAGTPDPASAPTQPLGAVAGDGTAPARSAASPARRRRRRRALAVIVAPVVLVLGVTGVAWALSGSGDEPPPSPTGTVPPGQPVPAVIGLSQTAADAAIRAARLAPKPIAVPRDTSCTKGQVTGQTPGASQPLAAGSEVTFTVCGGAGQVAVPNLAGLDETRARSALSGATLKARSGGTHRGGDCEPGTVYAQEPPAGRAVDENTTVRYTLCGERTVTVPALKGRGRGSAESALRAVGLYARFVDTDSGAPRGQVVGSNPVAGRAVKPGATVTVYLSRGNLVQVPTVVGMHNSDAIYALQQKEFDVSVEEQVDENATPGTVIHQDPRGGSWVKRGSTVHLTIAKAPDPASPPPDAT